MKQYTLLFLLSLSLLLSACGSESAPKQAAGDSVKTQPGSPEDSLPLPPPPDDSVLLPPSEPKESKNGDVAARGTFAGRMTYVSPYCGGAAPSKEILEEMRRPKPLEQYEFFLKNGSQNNGGPVVHRFRTDDAGNFKINLPPGTYCLCAKEQTVSAAFHPELYDFQASLTDEAAFKSWWKECRYSFQIRSGTTVEKNLHFEINCMTQSLCRQIKNQMANRLP